MEDIMQTIVNISKGAAYDIVSKQRDELLQENMQLRERVKYLEDLIKEYADKMTANLAPTIHRQTPES